MKRFPLLISIAAAAIGLLPVVGPFAASAGASVITIGNVNPGGAGTQPDPWAVGGNLYVGDSGSGTLNVAGGGYVSNVSGFLGNGSGKSIGIATVKDANSLWSNSGNLYVGRSASGRLNVEAGAAVYDSAGYIGYESSSTGVATVTGSGSQWNNIAGSLYVGRAGSGTLNVEAGAAVTSGGGYIGSESNSIGVATVSGAVSKWVDRNTLHVGRYGDGSLNVTAAGMVSSDGGSIGNFLNSTGAATITGFGSQWTNSGVMSVGRQGNGTLNVEDGGEVASTDGRIGFYTSSTGEVTVTDSGSQWNNSGKLYVGYEGTGTLNVQAGGVVSNSRSSIGYSNGSTGEVTVTGTDSQWRDSDWLTVGRAGSGTLNVEAGGVVSSVTGSIGRLFTSTGVATVTGANSLWNNRGDLDVGWQGDGILNVLAKGQVNVVGSTTIGSQGNINLNGGTLNTDSLGGSGHITYTTGGLLVSGADGLVVGGVSPLSSLVLNAGDTLDVAQTLTIESGITATVNGAMLEVGGLVGAGNLSFIDSGTYGLGSVTNSEGIGLTGTLGVGQANVSLVDADGVDMGSSTTLAGGTLTSSTGFALDGDDEISGYGQLFGHLALGTNGTIAGSGTGLTFYGDVSGTGSISDTTIYGNIDVGNSVGQLTLTDVVLGSDNTMVSGEIGGADSSLYDTITFAGDTTLAGELDIEFINEFVPEAGDVFDIFDFESANLSGLFNNVSLPALASDLEWDQSNLYTTGELLVSLSQIAGDFDSDGDVDGDDFLLWQRNFPVLDGTAGSSSGDANGDGNVDGDDFLIWQRNFPYPAAISSVPEPNSLALLALGGLMMPRRRRT